MFINPMLPCDSLHTFVTGSINISHNTCFLMIFTVNKLWAFNQRYFPIILYKRTQVTCMISPEDEHVPF